MNSRVKQAQKEGATVGDIAAGLAISVIKNALFKVIKIRDPHDVGTKVIVQGGTFLNDAVLRAFEQLSDVNAVRPDIAGNMGAFGAALARPRPLSRGAAARIRRSAASPPRPLTLASRRSPPRTRPCAARRARTTACSPSTTSASTRPRASTAASSRAIAARRAPARSTRRQGRQCPTCSSTRAKRLFDYVHAAGGEDAPRGTVGIPRALNLYENYPFWFTFFTKLGWRVVLSDPSTKKTYEAGIESMPSRERVLPGQALATATL